MYVDGRGRHGLIPAGAGRTGRSASRCCVLRAHPRWRGEDQQAEQLIVTHWGSSPLARGGHPDGVG